MKTEFRWWILLAVTVIFFEVVPVDIWVQDRLYDFPADHWLLSAHAWWPHLIFYSGIKVVFILFTLGLMATVVWQREHPMVVENRKGLLVVLLSCLLVPAVVGFLKSVTHVPCPRDLTLFGGRYPYVSLFDDYPLNFTLPHDIRCYPAGHASGGFALMSLYYLFPERRHALMALAGALALGWVIGGYKMLIGDHFLSHTVVSMLLAWILIRYINVAVTWVLESRSVLSADSPLG